MRMITTLCAFLTGVLLAAPVLIILLPLWSFNLAVNLVRSLLSWRMVTWSEMLRFEPGIGWQPLPNLRAPYFDRIGDRCSIETDSEGWPGRQSIEESDIVAFGDSFAFGYGATGDRAYFSLSQSPRIKPIGAPGYNMVQELMLMKRYAPRLVGKVVVWFICIENDLVENLKAYNPKFYTNPFLRKGEGDADWSIASDHVRRDKLMHGDGGISNRLLFSHLCTPCKYADRVFSAAAYLIREGKALCDREGAELVIFTIPYKFQMNKKGLTMLKGLLKDPAMFDVARPENVLEEICCGASIPFIRGSSHLTAADYKERDGHWNRRGNRKVAAVIQKFYQERQPRWGGEVARGQEISIPNLKGIQEGA